MEAETETKAQAKQKHQTDLVLCCLVSEKALVLEVVTAEGTINYCVSLPITSFINSVVAIAIISNFFIIVIWLTI